MTTVDDERAGWLDRRPVPKALSLTELLRLVGNGVGWTPVELSIYRDFRLVRTGFYRGFDGARVTLTAQGVSARDARLLTLSAKYTERFTLIELGIPDDRDGRFPEWRAGTYLARC